MTKITYIAAFTRQGLELACTIANQLEKERHSTTVFAPERLVRNDVKPLGKLSVWAKRSFSQVDALIFVSACGIAVRAIAPHVKDKFSDPAVVCIDERALFCVPLLSGHVGGANQLATTIADITGAQAAISTATDINGLFSVDQWAARRGFSISDRSLAKQVSVALLDNELVGFASDFEHEGPLPLGLIEIHESKEEHDLGIYVGCTTANPFPKTLRLTPKNVVVGMGCRREVELSQLTEALDAALEQAAIDPAAIATLASIDVKQDEPALHELAELHGWDLRFYSAEQLEQVPGTFSESEFVRATVGVGNVCERAAMLAATEKAREYGIAKSQLTSYKTKGDACTVALAQVMPTLNFN